MIKVLQLCENSKIDLDKKNPEDYSSGSYVTSTVESDNSNVLVSSNYCKGKSMAGEKKKPEVDASGKNDDSDCNGTNIVNCDKSTIFVPKFSDKGKSMNQGFFKTPRSLFKDPFWSTLPSTYRIFFITLIELVCYAPQKFNRNGTDITLQIGQVCITERELVQVMGKDFDKSLVHRIIKYFLKTKKIDQESNHKRSIITIIDPEVCIHLKNQVEPRIEPETNQKRTTKEEYKKEKKEKNRYSLRANLNPQDGTSDNICSVSSKPRKQASPAHTPKICFRSLVLLTSEEHSKLLQLYVPEKLEIMMDILENYKAANGKKYTSDYHVLLPTGWVLKRYEEDQNKSKMKGYNEKCKKPASESLGDGKPRFEPRILDFSRG